ncbi:MAG: hypothetical protein KDE46_04970 [Caldilineaceae bacterium]|nr:hypothetical protein [Caldilineaceae bacterium]
MGASVAAAELVEAKAGQSPEVWWRHRDVGKSEKPIVNIVFIRLKR